jgi:hypothetical protein
LECSPVLKDTSGRQNSLPGTTPPKVFLIHVDKKLFQIYVSLLYTRHYDDENGKGKTSNNDQPRSQNLIRGVQSGIILLDANTWLLGEELQFRHFQNHAMKRRTDVLRCDRFTLTPKIYQQIWDSTPAKTDLISIADDMVVRCWNIDTYQCAHSEYDKTKPDWVLIFAASPELRRKFVVEGTRSANE